MNEPTPNEPTPNEPVQKSRVSEGPPIVAIAVVAGIVDAVVVRSGGGSLASALIAGGRWPGWWVSALSAYAAYGIHVVIAMMPRLAPAAPRENPNHRARAAGQTPPVPRNGKRGGSGLRHRPAKERIP